MYLLSGSFEFQIFLLSLFFFCYLVFWNLFSYVFVLCAFSLCTLRLYRPYFVTAKCVLEEKLDVNKHAAKLHFSLALIGSENKEEGRKVEPITITNSDLEDCPKFFMCIKCLMQGPTLVESPSLIFRWPQELDWMILVPSNSDYSVILWFHNCNRWRWEFQTEQNTRMWFMLCSVRTLWAKLSSLVALQSASPSAQDLHWAEQWYLSNITVWLLCHFSCWGNVMELWQWV